jgi:hypothetical protein
MKRGRAEAILAEVQETVANWRRYAAAAGVPEATAERIANALKVKPFP